MGLFRENLSFLPAGRVKFSALRINFCFVEVDIDYICEK